MHGDSHQNRIDFRVTLYGIPSKYHERWGFYITEAGDGSGDGVNPLEALGLLRRFKRARAPPTWSLTLEYSLHTVIGTP